jgi:hypothetical protein
LVLATQNKGGITGRGTSIVCVEDVRRLEPLWPLRQRRNVVVACLDDPGELEAARGAFAELRAELVVERRPGPLSSALGRPSVTVASRFGRVGYRAEAASVARVLSELETFELACPECGPQAWGDPGGVR